MMAAAGADCQSPLLYFHSKLMGKNLIFQRVVIHFHHSHPAAPPHFFTKAVN